MQQLMELSDEQLLEKINAGELMAMDELMERYKRQVRNQARTLFLIGGDRDDLIQEGMLGLFKAIRDYNAQKGSFESFANVCISRQLYSAIQASNRQKHMPLNSYVELSPKLGEDAGDPQEKSPEELLIDQENIEGILDSIRKALNPREQELLQDYLDGRSYAEIAEARKKTPKAIDNALQRIRRKLRKN